MRLVRFGPQGQEKPGILDSDGRIRDLTAIVPDIAGETLSPTALATLRKIDLASLPVVSGYSSGYSSGNSPGNSSGGSSENSPSQVRLGACVGRWASLSASG